MLGSLVYRNPDLYIHPLPLSDLKNILHPPIGPPSPIWWLDGAILRLKLNDLCRKIPGSLKFIICIRHVILNKTAVWKFIDSLFQRDFKQITVIHIPWNCKGCMSSLDNGQKCTSQDSGSGVGSTCWETVVIALSSGTQGNPVDGHLLWNESVCSPHPSVHMLWP